jgi:hypothetical protein
MDAHEMALHRQGFAIAPLAMIATLARRQGIDLFDVEEHNRRLSDAVGFLSKGMDDPALMKRCAMEKQQLDEERAPGGATLLAWAEFWNAHSADSAWQSQLQKPLYDRFLGGNATLYTAPISEQAQTISGKAITQ